MRSTQGHCRDGCHRSSKDDDGKEHDDEKNDDMHHRLVVVVVGRRPKRSVRFVGLRGNGSVAWFIHVLLSVAAVAWSSSTHAAVASSSTTLEQRRDRHLRQRRQRAHSEDDEEEGDQDDDLTDMDLRMCMDMIQMPSSSSTTTTTTTGGDAVPFASQQVDQLVDHLNSMTQGRFGTYQDLTPSLRHHLWLYAKHQLMDHRTQRPPRDSGIDEPTPSLPSPSSSSSTPSLTYVRPICAHMVHGAQVLTIPFQFILQERSTGLTDSTTFTSLTTSNYPPRQRNRQQQQQLQQSWISKWQSLAPTLVQTQGFQCQNVSSSSTTTSSISTTVTLQQTPDELRHADNNLFLRHHQPPPQQQVIDQSSSPSAATECPYVVRINVRDVMYHVGCLPQKDETVTNQKCHLVTSTAVVTMTTTTNTESSTTTWTNQERDHVRRVTVAALAKSLQSSLL